MRTWVLADFADGAALLQATRRIAELGWPDRDTHTPYPVHGLDEALGLGRSPVPLLCLGGALVGAATAYWFQWFMNAVDYPINVGNRPPHSPPAFIVITFEFAILLAALFTFFGLMALFRFPRLHHPVFEVDAFRSASVDGFWLSVATDRREDTDRIVRHLEELGARRVHRVEESS